ncbi:transcriptional regulator /LysR family transcriptional regulator [Luteibacter rhizovicinus]|uniref:Transcriptional regulator /LysR family transcriptional regulator n=1 Tax=Luteibacter rhizovicinus TaxID=242606 RepID=A0A4R3YQS1_9GAMM|nr:LysR substrate-binding domain-containing protein [Luteibacter rhizovicinus]TCV93293.1 transcriptional regulator /LysR family transcriptional regulator [Luteibacter rhizovicinus]
MEGALQDLNDLYFFAAVVEHGGFSAAGRALGIPKSRLSKRIAQLEDRLGVRLLQRTTRRFVVTEIGERFYAHCRAVLEEARAAQDAVDELRTEPRGVVRVSCPVSLAQHVLGPMLPAFMLEHPKVQVRLTATNRRVDLIGEGFDVAIRVREKLDSDATLVLRSFGYARNLLVASPKFLDTHGRPKTLEDLAALPALSMYEHEGAQVWELVDTQGKKAAVEVRTRLISGDFSVLMSAALQCCGVALMPEDYCAPLIGSGELEWVLPEYSTAQGTLHFVYPSRRGLLPAIRSFVDFLADRLPQAQMDQHKECENARKKRGLR